MDTLSPAVDALLHLQWQNENLFQAIGALSGNISESLKTIAILQQENV